MSAVEGTTKVRWSLDVPGQSLSSGHISLKLWGDSTRSGFISCSSLGFSKSGVSSRGITVLHEGTVPPNLSPGHPVSSWVKDGSMGSISRSQSCESLPWVVHPPHSDSAFPRASPQFGRSNAAWSEPTFALLVLVVLSAAALGHAMFPPCRSVRPPSTVSFLSFVRSFVRSVVPREGPGVFLRDLHPPLALAL